MERLTKNCPLPRLKKVLPDEKSSGETGKITESTKQRKTETMAVDEKTSIIKSRLKKVLLDEKSSGGTGKITELTKRRNWL